MTKEESMHRKSLHIDNDLIPKEIIHRKRLYIHHEKDPHPTWRISTSDRKWFHNMSYNSMIIKSKNAP
jgi:hypothetical protein